MKPNCFLFLIIAATVFAACSRPSGCPSTFITKPKISQKDVNKWFAFKEKKSSNYREKEFFAMRTNTYRRNATMKNYFATTAKKRSADTERNFFGTFSSSKNKYRDMDAFASKPKQTRAQKEADHFSSPYRKKNRAGSQDYFLLASRSGSNKQSKDFFSSSSKNRRQRASYNRAEESPFASRSKQKQFVQREYQPDLFEPKVLWYKGKKRDKNAPKDSMGKEGEKDTE
jgi:hypothetical protein